MTKNSTVESICTFTLDSLFLGINVGEVHEVLAAQTLTPVPLAHSIIAGLINMRGQIVAAVDMRRVLRLPDRTVETPPPVNVIVRNEHTLISLLVDELGDVLDVESHLFTVPPDTTTAETKGLFRGAYQLPQKLLLVFDVVRTIEAIVAQARPRQSWPST